MFREGKGRISGPLAFVAFYQTCWKEGVGKHEPKGNLGSLHKIPIRRHSLPIKPAYKALLGCTCASGRMYTSDNWKGKKKDIFLMRGILWTCSIKGLEAKKCLTAHCEQSILRRKKDWSIAWNWILKKRKRKKKTQEKSSINVTATLTSLNLAGKRHASQWPLWLNSHLTLNVPTCHNLFSSLLPAEHGKKYTCTKTVKSDLKATLGWHLTT